MKAEYQIGVIGGGQMGNGIAQVAAVAGSNVTLFDISETVLNQALKTIETNLGRIVKKGSLTSEAANSAFKRVNTVTDLNHFRQNFDYIIEAVTENETVKSNVFNDVCKNLEAKTILCSNTSSLPITKLATATDRPDRFIGMHFMNPVPVMKLVEIIPGLATSQDTLNAVLQLATKMGKQTSLSKDYPGFIANRILAPMLNEAAFVVYEGIGDVVSVDLSMKLGMNHPMGPLTLADFVGLDTLLYILDVLYKNFRDPKFRACPLLVQLVHAGRFGRKSGIGFYDYSVNPPVPAI